MTPSPVLSHRAIIPTRGFGACSNIISYRLRGLQGPNSLPVENRHVRVESTVGRRRARIYSSVPGIGSGGPGQAPFLIARLYSTSISCTQQPPGTHWRVWLRARNFPVQPRIEVREVLFYWLD